MPVEYSAEKTAADLDQEQVTALFDSINWPHAQVPEELMKAISNSEVLITAWDGDRLIGLANSVGDRVFYAYIHWLIVHEDFQRQGIGSRLLVKLLAKLENRNQVFVFSDTKYAGLWERMGFIILSADADEPAAHRQLVAGFRWHPIPGVHYELDAVDAEDIDA